jgi:hypothetical protein
VLRGLTGTSLSPRPGDKHRAERLRDNARRVADIFYGAAPNQLLSDQKQDDLQADWEGPITRFMDEIKKEAYDQQARQAALDYPQLKQIPSGPPNTASDAESDRSGRNWPTSGSSMDSGSGVEADDEADDR